VRFESFADAVDCTRALAAVRPWPRPTRACSMGNEARLHRVAFGRLLLLSPGLRVRGSSGEPRPRARARALAADHGGVVRGEPRHHGRALPRAPPATPARGAPPSSRRRTCSLRWCPSASSATPSRPRVHGPRSPRCIRRWSGAVTEALLSECGGGVVSCRFTHVYADGPAPVLHVPWPGARRAGTRAVARHQGRGVPARWPSTAARSPTTTRVGRTHVDGYRREVPQLMRAGLAAVKQAWDPQHLMNPGVLGL
jgi:alkyldihydroxyacetonephosphate synthase